MSKAIAILDLPKGSAFTFQADSNRPKDVYFFKGIDGMYAQVFGSLSDMKAFKNPAFVGLSTTVVPEVY